VLSDFWSRIDISRLWKNFDDGSDGRSERTAIAVNHKARTSLSRLSILGIAHRFRLISRTWHSPLALLEFKSCFPISLLACSSRHASFDIPQPRRWCAHMRNSPVLLEVKKASCGIVVEKEYRANEVFIQTAVALAFG